MNDTPLINRKHLKDFALACGAQRAWKPTRVSADFYAKANAVLRNFVADYVARHPSVGMTIK